MQGRYTTFPTRHLGRPVPVPDTAIKAALMRALESAWRNPNHTIYEHFGAAPLSGAVRASSTRPNQKD